MAQLIRILDLQVGPRQNEAMNRYWLDQAGGFTVDLMDVAQAFVDQHIDLVRIVQSVEWEHVAIFLEDVLSGASLLVDLIGFIGERGQDPLPASNAFSFPLKPVGPTLKRGGKRLPGVGKTDVNDEVVDGSAMLALLSGVALSMWLPIDVGGVVLEQAVVRPVGTPPSSYIVSPLNGAIYRQVGSQVSRKLSRGGGTSLSGLVPHLRTNYTTTASYTAFTDQQLQDVIDDNTALRQALAYTPSEVTRFPL